MTKGGTNVDIQQKASFNKEIKRASDVPQYAYGDRREVWGTAFRYSRLVGGSTAVAGDRVRSVADDESLAQGFAVVASFNPEHIFSKVEVTMNTPLDDWPYNAIGIVYCTAEPGQCLWVHSFIG